MLIVLTQSTTEHQYIPSDFILSVFLCAICKPGAQRGLTWTLTESHHVYAGLEPRSSAEPSLPPHSYPFGHIALVSFVFMYSSRLYHTKSLFLTSLLVFTHLLNMYMNAGVCMLRSWATLWDMGTKFRSSGLCTSTCIHCAVFIAL